MNGVASVTVTFNPDASRLARQIAALQGQVDEIIIVDNASEREPAVPSGNGTPVRFVRLNENLGVAAALNIGIDKARGRGARFVLLLDHDSVPTPSMVAALVAGYNRCVSDSGLPIAAVGPRVFDARDRQPYPFIQLGWLRNRHVHCGANACDLVSSDFLISSGTLLPVEAFERIGPFDESLFVDSVDLEWCCRARGRGFALFGVCSARLDHWLGDRRRRLMGRVALVVHSPQRLYYMTRNRLLLYQRGYMPFKWKIKDLLRSLAKFVATMVFLAPRREYFVMTYRAVRDALHQRGGRYPSVEENAPRSAV